MSLYPRVSAETALPGASLFTSQEILASLFFGRRRWRLFIPHPNGCNCPSSSSAGLSGWAYGPLLRCRLRYTNNLAGTKHRADQTPPSMPTMPEVEHLLPTMLATS
jgi:hypothetical protein